MDGKSLDEIIAAGNRSTLEQGPVPGQAAGYDVWEVNGEAPAACDTTLHGRCWVPAKLFLDAQHLVTVVATSWVCGRYCAASATVLDMRAVNRRLRLSTTTQMVSSDASSASEQKCPRKSNHVSTLLATSRVAASWPACRPAAVAAAEEAAVAAAAAAPLRPRRRRRRRRRRKRRRRRMT